jgi:hypothetical protein
MPSEIGLSRRRFVEAAAALSLAPVAGCCHRADLHTEDPDVGRPNRPQTLSVIVGIREGKTDALQQRLRGHVFENPRSGVHFARMTILPDDRLLLSGVYDDHRSIFIDFLVANAQTVDPLLELVEGWPPQGAHDREALDAWVTTFSHETLLLYSAFSRASDPAIRETVALRDNFLKLVRSVAYEPSRAETAYHAFLLDNRARIDMHQEGGRPDLTPLDFVSPHDQNPFTMIYQMRPDQMTRLNDTLAVGQWAIDNFHIHPLRQIPTVQYARFVRLHGDAILFASCYDGEWEQYVQDFAARIPSKLDKVWGGAVGYPTRGAKDAAALAKFLDDRRIERDFFYMAAGRRTVKEIQASLSLGTKLLRWSARAPARGDELVTSLHRFVAEHQRLLA